MLDIPVAALEQARQRLGKRASSVEWCEASVTKNDPTRQFGLWHDRAVFHSPTNKGDRQKYVEALKRRLTDDGYVILATLPLMDP
ncbi:MAG: class I SAM-dependent methyltransferase [Verrucomicrobiota bacterium]|nr:hypothetical protein [Limisphaerales bacterium]